MSDVHWFEFDGPEAKGRVGVEPRCYGLQIYLGDEQHSIGLVDLFYVAQGLDLHGFPPHAQLVIDDGHMGDPLGYVKYLPQGARLYLECDVHPQGRNPHYGQSFGREEE